MKLALNMVFKYTCYMEYILCSVYQGTSFETFKHFNRILLIKNNCKYNNVQ